MALINCPECEKVISDKVKTCPNCGFPLSTDDDNVERSPQQVEVTSVNLSPKDPAKKKKFALYAVIAVVAIVAITLIWYMVKSSNEASARASYIENLKSARITMLSGAADAEGLCSLAESVWYNTIYEKHDSETDKFTCDSFGYFNSDFNTSLANLYSDDSTKSTISTIEENQQKVVELIKALQNPTDEFQACYQTIDSMYEAYQELTGLAVSPTGSLKTYSSNFSTYDSDFLKYYNKLNTQIPEE